MSSYSENLSTLSLKQVLNQYDQTRIYSTIKRCGSGNINDTFLVDNGNKRFILQRINEAVFPDPIQVVENSVNVTHFLNTCSAIQSFYAPEIISTVSGRYYAEDEAGKIWRAQEYVENSLIYETVMNKEMAFEIGAKLAVFHSVLAKFPVGDIRQTLPGFHYLPGYLEKYDSEMSQNTPIPDQKSEYCHFIINRFREAGNYFQVAKKQHKVKETIIHGDPKVANFLFDATSNGTIALIDLDTVGPGLILHDLGDCLRSACCTVSENDRRETAQFDLRLFKEVVAGYCSHSKLTDFEKNSVFEAVFLITYELGVRFFTDYLAGSIYFSARYPEENLERAVVQFSYCESIVKQEKKIRGVMSTLV